MYRRELIPILLRQRHSLMELAHLVGEPLKDVEEDLHHLLKSMKRMPYRTVIEPAVCRQCGFRFRHDKLHKPSRCPQCKSNWISDPLISIEEE